MNPYIFSVLFFAFGAFLLGLLIYLRRQDKLGIYYFAFSACAAIWGVFFSIMLEGRVSYKTALSLSRFNNVAAMFIPIFWFHISSILSGNSRKKTLTMFYAIALGIALFSFTNWFVPDLKPIAGFRYYTQAGPLFYFYNALFVFATTAGFLELIGKSRNSNREERIQLMGLMLATLAGFTAGLPTFLPCYGIDLPQYGLFLMPLYPFVMAYFMMRKDLFSLAKFVEAAHRDKLAVIGTLATSLNHEIKNPLYIIQGLSESHLENLEENIYQNPEVAIQKSKEILSKTRDQATRAMEIMRGFASFAKQSVNEEAQLEDVSLDLVLDDIVPLVNHELELDKIQLVRQIPKGFLPIRADRHHIEEILFNLIVNSCQAMKEGGEIRISAAQQNGCARVTIEDTGPGIAPDRLKQIFEPFYTTKQEGTGLGLYVVKQLVERNGGKISVKSKLGKGTSFVMEFKR
jgi:signal transduction histidine kinase